MTEWTTSWAAGLSSHVLTWPNMFWEYCVCHIFSQRLLCSVWFLLQQRWTEKYLYILYKYIYIISQVQSILKHWEAAMAVHYVRLSTAWSSVHSAVVATVRPQMTIHTVYLAHTEQIKWNISPCWSLHKIIKMVFTKPSISLLREGIQLFIF